MYSPIVSVVAAIAFVVIVYVGYQVIIKKVAIKDVFAKVKSVVKKDGE